ncbi:hypothetical protein PROFUN_12803 [Planoprotostelium fungivorum]|uniref:Uncharacterized protein n=1 Tax=Planoprotostelium fungivorum TaxID=1890364 RepID=A0A2P6N6P7_9EUKA|nr:hypothetical protein PROFUN_12803 [Planoprotostelium fungivorum]
MWLIIRRPPQCSSYSPTPKSIRCNNHVIRELSKYAWRPDFKTVQLQGEAHPNGYVAIAQTLLRR